MIKIYKDNMVLEVPRGSFKHMYKPAGWSLEDPNPGDTPYEAAEASGELGGDTTPLDNETPTEASPEAVGGSSDPDEDTLRGMSEDELRQYASLLGIRVKELKSREKLIRAIKNHHK